MNTRRFPPAVVAIVSLTLWVHLAASVAAQEAGTPASVPGAAAPTQLNQGAADILKLVRAKIHDDVTEAFIRNGDRHYSLTANEIVFLRQEGVSDRVLTAMLNQQPQTGAALLLQEAAPTTVFSDSAPQYDTPPPTTTVFETAPASTVYVVPSTPTYYSFYDPWPYWYSAWPYWGPYVSFGFYWGWNNWNRDCYWGGDYRRNVYYQHNRYDQHNGKPHPPNGKPPPNRNPPPPGGNPASTGKSGMLAGERSRTGVDQTAFNRGANTSAGTPTTARPTSQSSQTGSQSVTSRTGERQANAASARSGQGAGPTSVWSSGANNRTAAASPNASPAAPQFAGGANNSSPTRVWTSSASQRTTPRPAAVAPSTRVNPSPTTAWNRSASQSANRSVARPAASYQRNSNPSYSPRPGVSAPNISRPSMSSSVRSMGNASAFRGGSSFGGSGAPRMSPGGGGSRGGGGGGGRSR
ncbi:MAG: hypothetical protein IH623_08650 [Verrucomicrobia bacterium]|nr:hypothetical protein [Verrucomicrobiota bacterium]